jgi:CDP-paratose synthetase
LKKTILLTGANGFLGSHLVYSLISEEYEIIILKRSNSDLWRLKDLVTELISYDIDTESMELAFKNHKIDCIIHTACNYGRNNNSLNNIIGSNLTFGLNLLELAVKYKVKSFINTDTFLTPKLNAYSLSKSQFLEWLKLYSNQIQVLNLKLEHMYGPKDDQNKFMFWLISQLKQNINEIPLTTGVQKRDFIYIKDVVSAFICVLNKIDTLNQYAEFEVGTGNSVAVKDFVRLIVRKYESTKGTINTKLNFGAIPYRKGEIMDFKVNNQHLKALGWQPLTSLEKGIEISLNHII